MIEISNVVNGVRVVGACNGMPSGRNRHDILYRFNGPPESYLQPPFFGRARDIVKFK